MKLLALVAFLALPDMAWGACTITTGPLRLEKPSIGDNMNTWTACLRNDLDVLSSSVAITGDSSTNMFNIIYVSTIGARLTSPEGYIHISSPTVFVSSNGVSAFPLVMGRDFQGAEKWRFTNNGFFGINTSAPATELHVVGTATINAVRINNASHVQGGQTVIGTSTFVGASVFQSSVTGSLFVGPLTGNAATATALAANGANCSAGQYPLGVDASGAVESCTVAGSGDAVLASTQTFTGSNSFHNPVKIGLGGTPLPIVSTGTWTPTATCTANCASCGPDGTPFFLRVGNVVHVTFGITIDPTAGSETDTQCTWSLPPGNTSNFATSTDAQGSGSSASTEYGVVVYGDSTSDVLVFRYPARSADGRTFYGTAMFVVK